MDYRCGKEPKASVDLLNILRKTNNLIKNKVKSQGRNIHEKTIANMTMIDSIVNFLKLKTKI